MVTFTLPGFSVVKRKRIELTGAFTATVNADMRVGAVEETVTVTGESGGGRRGQDIPFDQDGNVWESDRGIPRRLVKLYPRTGERKEWVTPHPKSDVHEVLVGRDGMIWMPEHTEGGVPSFLLGFNPKTEKWERNIDLDPENAVRNSIKWMQSTAMDSTTLGAYYVNGPPGYPFKVTTATQTARAVAHSNSESGRRR